jgi:hypothetical protein
LEKRFHGRRRSCSAQSERWAEREGRGEAEGVRGREENAVSTFNSCNNTNHNERINAAEDMGVETRARGREGTEARLTFFSFRFQAFLFPYLDNPSLNMHAAYAVVSHSR